MVEINNISDLKPYVRYISAKYLSSNYSYVAIEIVEDKKLADVTINCDLDLTFSLVNISDNVFNIEKALADDSLSLGCEIRLFARNIYVKKELYGSYIECENIYFEDRVALDFLVANDTVKGKSISSRDIICKNLEAEYVSSKCMNVINFKAASFYNDGIVFTNISYHQPDFSEEIVKNWDGVKIRNFDLQKDHSVPLF